MSVRRANVQELSHSIAVIKAELVQNRTLKRREQAVDAPKDAMVQNALRPTPVSAQTVLPVTGEPVPQSNVELKIDCRHGELPSVTVAKPNPEQQTAAEDLQEAAKVLQQQWDLVGTGKSGSADKAQLEAVMRSASTPDGLKDAIRTILDSGAFDAIAQADGRGSSMAINRADLNVVNSRNNMILDNVVRGDGVQAVAEMGIEEAADILENNWDKIGTGKGQTADAAQLSAVLYNPSTPTDIKKAIDAVLSQPGGFSAIASATRGNPQMISRSDLALVNSPGNMVLQRLNISPVDRGPVRVEELKQALETLDANWDQVGTGKSRQADPAHLKALLAQPNVSPAIKGAINTLRNVPGGIDTIAMASGRGSFGSIDRADIRAALTNGSLEALATGNLTGPAGREQDMVSAARILENYWRQIGTGKAGTADAAQLKSILSDAKAPDELKFAINTVLNTADGFSSLATSTGRHNRAQRTISHADLHAFLSGAPS